MALDENGPSWSSLLNTVRGPACVILGIAVALGWPSQTSDIIAGLWESNDIWHTQTIIFHLLLAVLGLSAWHWARAALSARFQTVDTRAHRQSMQKDLGRNELPAIVLLPRLLFVGTFMVDCMVTWRSRGAELEAGWLAALPSLAVTLGIWSAGLLLLIWRLPIQRRITGHEDQTAAARDPHWLRSAPASLNRLLRHAPFGPVAAAMLMALALVVFIASTFGTLISVHGSRVVLPLALGRALHGPGAVMLAFAVMLAPLTALTFGVESLSASMTILGLSLRARDIPAICLLAAIMGFVPKHVHLHQVRVVTTAGALRPAQRLTLEKMLEAWSSKCLGTGPLRPVIVAISGGASRAGLWGARVLEVVDQAARASGTGIFAISSVSGGSLGAAGYMTWRAGQQGVACGQKDQPEAAPDGPLKEALRGDALGPLLAGAVFGDLPRALAGAVLLPATPFTDVRLPRGGDRAAALERAFEVNWRTAFANTPYPGHTSVPGLDQPYLALGYSPQPPHRILDSMPIWIANGTDEQQGERLLTVPFTREPGEVAAGRGSDLGWPFDGAKDVLSLVDADMPVSAVIDNTARFPVLSPDGELARVREQLIEAREDHPTQIIDGGYFDNEGMQTASELAIWLETRTVNGRRIRPILVQATGSADGIDSDIDPKLPRCTGSFHDEPGTSEGRKAGDQLGAPLRGLNGVREGHSGLVLRQVLNQFCDKPQRFFHLYLYDEDHHPHAVPLNWSLSSHITNYIWCNVFDPSNIAELQKLTSSLGELATESGLGTPAVTDNRPVGSLFESKPLGSSECMKPQNLLQ